MYRMRCWFAWMARIPLRWRLALGSFGLLALLLGALGGFLSYSMEQTLLSNTALHLRNQAQLAISSQPVPANGGEGRDQGHSLSLVSPGQTPPPVGVMSLSDDTSGFHPNDFITTLASPNVHATIYSPQGNVISSTDNIPLVPTAIPLSDDLIQQKLIEVQQADSYMLFIDSQGQRQLVVIYPLVSNQQTVEVLELSTPTSSIDDSITTLRWILALGVLVALSIAAGLILPLVGAALSPLVKMEQTSKAIANGELSLRLDIPPTDDEIGRLAVSFNSMVAQLEAAFARQKQFVADASHELRTPLTALGGGLEMLLVGADRGDTEASRRLLRGMYAEVERMRRLVEDLLALSRIDQGRIQLRETTVDIKTLLQQVYEQAQHLSHGQEVQLELETNLPSIRADADRLKQVLLNILDNALKFTPVTGSVHLSAKRDGERTILITVQDTGIGIPEEALSHVFDRFYRVDTARSRLSPRAGGNGLGLAIAKELIEAHGGTISISSSLNVGTTVTIRLKTTR